MSNDPISLYDYEERAKLTLSHNDWDTIDAGAMDMFTPGATGRLSSH